MPARRRGGSAKRRVCDGEACAVLDEADAGQAEEAAQLVGGQVFDGNRVARAQTGAGKSLYEAHR